MKTTVKIILRSLAATPLKTTIVYAGILSLMYIDFRPLPLWIGDVLGYAIHFGVAYALAWWVLHKRSGRWLDGTVVVFNFVVVGALLEIFLYALLRGPSVSLVSNLFTWQSAAVNLCYFLGVACAWMQVRMALKRGASQV